MSVKTGFFGIFLAILVQKLNTFICKENFWFFDTPGTPGGASILEWIVYESIRPLHCVYRGASEWLLFVSSTNSQNSIISFNYSWFLAQNPSNFVSLPWKLHNRPDCHIYHFLKNGSIKCPPWTINVPIFDENMLWILVTFNIINFKVAFIWTFEVIM